MLEKNFFSLSEVLPALSLIIDHQADGNLYHGARVAVIAYHLEKLINKETDATIFYAGFLHDIGLFETGEHIALSLKNLAQQKMAPPFFNHPCLGAAIVKEIPGMENAVEPIKEHHENFDGSGYPFGKRGKEISFKAVVLRMADGIDLFLRRNYGILPFPLSGFIQNSKKKEFSPELCAAFFNLDTKLFPKIILLENVKSYYAYMSDSIGSAQVKISENEGEVLLKIFSRAIDGKHHYTKEHSRRVAEYAFRIAKNLGLDEKELRNIKAAGYLHDIGKIAIPNSILDKPGPLTKEEWQVIKTHATISYDIVRSVAYFKDISEIVFTDQESFDGSGYPNGLKGDEIPLGGRMIMVADAIDAMLSDRAYRKALPVEKAIDELKNNSGTQFDPEIAKEGINLLSRTNPLLPVL